MEQQIFKRLQMIYPVTTMDNSKCAAKEIDTLTHSHYMKFIEWFQKGLHSFGRIGYIDNLLYINFKEGSEKQYTLEDIYQYWQNNKL